MSMNKAAYAIAVLLFASVLLFSACSQKTKTPEDVFAGRSGNYSAAARISYKKIKAEAKISQETPASCTVVFESPESLKDMAFTFRGDSTDITYKGLSFSFEQDSLPAAAMAKMAVSTISAAMCDEAPNAVVTGDVIEIAGIMEKGEFILTVDKETAGLIKLLIPDEEFEIEFNNFTFLD